MLLALINGNALNPDVEELLMPIFSFNAETMSPKGFCIKQTCPCLYNAPCSTKEFHCIIGKKILYNLTISKIPTMPKHASKPCFSLFILFSLLVNYGISADSSEKYAPTASESVNNSTSSVPPAANIPDIVTESNRTLPGQNVSTLSNSNVTTDLQTEGAQTKGGNNIPTSPSPSPSIIDNSVLDTRDMDSVSQENTSVPLSNADPPAAETKGSGIEDIVQENTSSS
ncbi:hypothetical protein V6N13_072734 [Hibiscus sabdariffa]|uniref:Uncharacterized protein n=1 Tax=Hibiscus sabdariffa TaxID=183260 RepID=A0ABR2E709_9ROSI